MRVARASRRLQRERLAVGRSCGCCYSRRSHLPATRRSAPAMQFGRRVSRAFSGPPQEEAAAAAEEVAQRERDLCSFAGCQLTFAGSAASVWRCNCKPLPTALLMISELEAATQNGPVRLSTRTRLGRAGWDPAPRPPARWPSAGLRRKLATQSGAAGGAAGKRRARRAVSNFLLRAALRISYIELRWAPITCY